MKRSYALLAVLGSSLLLSACTPVGAGLAVGSAAGTAAAREGGIPTALKDAQISARIKDLWFRNSVEMFTKTSATVDQGRVLLTGVVQKPEHRVEAVRLAWQAEGVRQVINEIKVANSEGIKGWARDSWISGRLKAALLFDKNIQSVNYSIDTVQSTVYLMGIAQSQAELSAVTTHARSVPYVKQVVSYVKLAGTPIDQAVNAPTPTGAPSSTSPNGGAGMIPVQQQTGVMTSPEPVTAQPLGTQGGTMQGDYIQPNQLGAPNPPPASAPRVPGRPGPIVDQGF